MNRCVFRLESLYGPLPCGREATVYDRARKGWLCRDHSQERLCEFCQGDRAWARLWHQRDRVATESWLCLACAGVSLGKRKRP